MRVDLIVRDVRQSVESIIRALSNQITAEDNLSPEGLSGQVLTSRGPNQPPTYQFPKMPVLTADPASPAVGEFWYRSDLDVIRVKTSRTIETVEFA